MKWRTIYALLRIETANLLGQVPASEDMLFLPAGSTEYRLQATIKVRIFQSTLNGGGCMPLECILYVPMWSYFMSHQGSVGPLRRGSGLLLTRTIRARSQRLQEMMDVPVHNLKWIVNTNLQKQSKVHTEEDAKEKGGCTIRHDVRSCCPSSLYQAVIPAPWISKQGQQSVQRARWHHSICYSFSRFISFYRTIFTSLNVWMCYVLSSRFKMINDSKDNLGIEGFC